MLSLNVNVNCLLNVNLLIFFITGGAGVGKSRLIETCHQFLTKIFNSYAGCPEKSKGSFAGTNRDLSYKYFRNSYQLRPGYPNKYQWVFT